VKFQHPNLQLVRRHAISVGCGLLSLALILTVYLREDEIPQAEAELAKRSAERDQIALNIKNSAQLAEQNDSLVGSLRQIESRLIRPTDLGTNTQYFYTLEQETGVKIADLRQGNVGPPAQGAPAKLMPVGFSIGAQGTLPQILNFLRQLEGGRHYCRVLTASFVGNSASRNAVLTVALNVEILGQQ
jgi:hypothetical protein